MKKTVVIIGGGIGGLATANLLAKAGFSVAVYEKNSDPGGRAGQWHRDGFTFDTGPSWYLMPEVFEHYFNLLDESVTEHLNLSKLSPAYKVYFEGQKSLEVTSDLATDIKTFDSIEKGAGKQLKKYVTEGSVIYRLALKHFLYTNFTSPKDFMHTDVLGKSATMLNLALTPIDRYVRRYVTDSRLVKILEYPMVFLGSSPFSAPAIYSLMSALDFKEGVFYPQGGIYKIIEQLVAIGNELGVRYYYNSPVTKIITKDKKACGIELTDKSIVDADIVISNADLHFTETKLLQPEEQSYPEKYWSQREAGPSALLMYLGVKGKLPNLRHHNLYFVKDWKGNFDSIFAHKNLPKAASLYICKPSATDPTVAPKGSENVFILVPLPAGITLNRHSMNTLADTYLNVIQQELAIPDLKERIVVKKIFGPNDFQNTYNSWLGSALGPSHVLRQSAMFRTPNKSKKLKNLYYVGGFTAPGIGLPMCLISAELVYKRLIGIKRGGRVERITRLDEEKS